MRTVESESQEAAPFNTAQFTRRKQEQATTANKSGYQHLWGSLSCFQTLNTRHFPASCEPKCPFLDIARKCPQNLQQASGRLDVPHMRRTWNWKNTIISVLRMSTWMGEIRELSPTGAWTELLSEKYFMNIKKGNLQFPRMGIFVGHRDFPEITSCLLSSCCL